MLPVSSPSPSCSCCLARRRPGDCQAPGDDRPGAAPRVDAPHLHLCAHHHGVRRRAAPPPLHTHLTPLLSRPNPPPAQTQRANVLAGSRTLPPRPPRLPSPHPTPLSPPPFDAPRTRSPCPHTRPLPLTSTHFAPPPCCNMRRRCTAAGLTQAPCGGAWGGDDAPRAAAATRARGRGGSCTRPTACCCTHAPTHLLVFAGPSLPPPVQRRGGGGPAHTRVVCIAGLQHPAHPRQHHTRTQTHPSGAGGAMLSGIKVVDRREAERAAREERRAGKKEKKRHHKGVSG